MYEVSEFRGTCIGQNLQRNILKIKTKKEGEADEYLQIYDQKIKVS